MVEQKPGGRTAAEIVERAKLIQVRHHQNPIEEGTREVKADDVVGNLERDFHPVTPPEKLPQKTPKSKDPLSMGVFSGIILYLKGKL